MKTIPKCASNLSKIIQCPTVSLSAEEDTPKAKNANFDQLHKTLKQLYPNVFMMTENIRIGSYSFILRWKGKDSSRSMVLMAHQDVVPAGVPTGKDFDKSFIPEGWTYPPFSGEITDTEIRGRGTLDDKGSLCALFESIEDLILEDFTPAIDVYLCSSHNEETGGWGAPLIVEELKKRGVTPDFVLDEGGAIVDAPLPTMKKQGAMVGLCEKGIANVLFTAKSKGGHASAPPKSTPLGRLGALVCDIEKNSPFKAVVTEPVHAMLQASSPSVSFPLSILFKYSKGFSSLIAAAFKAFGGEPKALVQTTCAFTMAQGSSAVNVLPNNATVTANLRLLGGVDTLDSIVKDLQKRAKKYHVDVTLLFGHEPSNVSKRDTSWEYIKTTIEKQFPDVLPIPYIMIAASDSRHFDAISDCVYRFAPFIMKSKQRKTIHGFDEHVTIESFERGIGFYKELIRGL